MLFHYNAPGHSQTGFFGRKKTTHNPKKVILAEAAICPPSEEHEQDFAELDKIKKVMIEKCGGAVMVGSSGGFLFEAENAAAFVRSCG